MVQSLNISPGKSTHVVPNGTQYARTEKDAFVKGTLNIY